MKPESAKPLAGLLLILAVGLGITGLILWRDSQPLFQSTASVRVVRDQTDRDQLGTNAPPGMEQTVFLQTQTEILRSEAVLQKVVDQFALNSKWAHPPGDALPLAAAETLELLRKRTQVVPEPGMAVLRIEAASPDRAAAPKLADALAAAYCEYRMERRRRIAQEEMAALTAPYQEHAEKVRLAAERVEQTFAVLDPAVRESNQISPSNQDDATRRQLRSQLSRGTMAYIVQSNQLAQLALNKTFPADELAKLTAQLEQTKKEMAALGSELQTAVHKQEALQAYRDAGEVWGKARRDFAPLKTAVEEYRRLIESQENPPAIVEEPAGVAIPLPTHKAVASQASLAGAGALLLAGVGLFFSARKPQSKR